MNSPDKDWWIVHTGEYVLGILEAQDTVVLKRVMQHEPDVEKMVADWSNWFQPISDSLTPIEPPAHLLPALLSNLPAQQRRASATQNGSTGADGNNSNKSVANSAANSSLNQATGTGIDSLGDSTSVMALFRKNQKQTDGWRAFAAMAVVAFLGLILYLGVSAA